MFRERRDELVAELLNVGDELARVLEDLREHEPQEGGVERDVGVAKLVVGCPLGVRGPTALSDLGVDTVHALRECLGNKLDVAGCLDQGRLLLVRLPKGTLGEDTSRLLGSFVVARVWQAALARASRAEAERPDCALYVDEVHNYLSLPTPIGDMLAEARGYRLSLCLAHQHLAQLPREMREAIAANARSKLYFQLSLPDAHALGRELEPELSEHDLANLPRHSAAARICQQGETGRPFTLTTDPLPGPDPDRAKTVREASRTRLGTERKQVEARLARRSRRGGGRR